MESLRIITEEHQNLWRIAITMDMVADEIDNGSQVDPAFFRSVFDYIEQFVDRAHHPKEDDFLFRLMRQRSEAAASILDRLQAEHQNGPENLKTLRQALAESASSTDKALVIFRLVRLTSACTMRRVS